MTGGRRVDGADAADGAVGADGASVCAVEDECKEGSASGSGMLDSSAGVDSDDAFCKLEGGARSTERPGGKDSCFASSVLTSGKRSRLEIEQVGHVHDLDSTASFLLTAGG